VSIKYFIIAFLKFKISQIYNLRNKEQIEIESRDKGYRCTYLFEGNSWL